MNKRLAIIAILTITLILPITAARADMLASVALVYKEQQQTLRKMWQARKDGDTTEVQRLSDRLNNFIDRQKRLAKVNLEMSQASINRLKSETPGQLDSKQKAQMEQQRASINEQVQDTQDRIRIIQAQFIRDNINDRRDIASSEKRLADLDTSYIRVINSYKEPIKKGKEALAWTKKAIQKDLVDRRATIMKSEGEDRNAHQKKLNNVLDLVAAGNYTPFTGYGSWGGINKINDWIDHHEGEIARITAEKAAGNWKDHPMGYTANEINGWIVNSKKVLVERRKMYTTGEYSNLIDHMRHLRQLRMELIGLDIKLGGHEKQLNTLETQARELQVFLDHKFDTTLPKEDSAWVKAINWCGQAYNKVQEIRNKVGKFKVLYDVLQGGNPVKAADTLLEITTGKGVADTLMKYPPFNKLLKFGALKDAIITGKIDREKLIRQVAEKNLDKGLIKTYDLLNRFKNDPKSFLKDNASKQVEAILQANPRIKNAIDSYAQAQEYARNPRLIEQHLQDRMTKSVLKKARELDSFKAVESSIEEGRRKIEAFEAQINDQTENLKGQALKAVMESEAVRTARAKIAELNQAGIRMESQLQDKLNQVEKTFIESGSGQALKNIQDTFKITKSKIERMLDLEKTSKDLFDANLTRSVIKSYDETNQYAMGKRAATPRKFGEVMMDDFSFQD